jgi:glycosyltransferase involved in cell wall biosynthesis
MTAFEPEIADRGQETYHRRKILLVSNRVMHYRVSVYNYFHRRFRESGFEFSVIADSLQKENRTRPDFELWEMPFDFFHYRKKITDIQPDAVILFLRMKEWITWPLMHWLKLRGIPFAFWTKGGNWDAKESRLRYQMFNYAFGMSDALILYSESCRELVKAAYRSKAFVANNTLNFEEFPAVPQSKEEIKREFGIPFRKVVIFVGRMGAEQGRKRVDHLIDIFRKLDRSDIGLVLVGSGLSQELQARMNPVNTLYLGEVQDAQNLGISKLCKMADVCAIPGHVGLGLNQAFYWSLPVVTEESDHPPEVGYLQPGRNGFMVPANDLAALEDRLLYLLDNDRVLAEFSQHAREDILEHASIENMFRGFQDCANYLTQATAIEGVPRRDVVEKHS